MDSWRTWIARLFMLACLALGIIGLIAGFTDKEWKLGVVGWFTGGTLLGVVAVITILDDFAQRQRTQQ